MNATLLATSNPLIWYVTRATGVMALILLTGSMVLGLLTTARAASAGLPRFAVAELHRRVSLLSVVFLGIHVLTAVLDTYVHISLAAVVVPFYPGYSPLWIGLGAVSFDLMAAVVATSLLRRLLPASLWRGVHWLAYLSWPLALAHTVGIGSDMRFGWLDALVALCILSVLVAFFWRLWARSDARVAPQSGSPGRQLVSSRQRRAAP